MSDSDLPSDRQLPICMLERPSFGSSVLQRRSLGQFWFRHFLMNFSGCGTVTENSRFGKGPNSEEITPYRRLLQTIDFLLRTPDNDFARVDLAPGKTVEGLLQGYWIKRNDLGDLGLELPLLGPANGLF